MQLNRLHDGIKIAGASGAALVVVMFFPWFGRSAEALGREIGSNVTAWQAFGFSDILLLALAALVIVLAMAEAGGGGLQAPGRAATIVTGAGVAALILIAYRLIDTPFDLARKYGVFLGLVAAAGIVYGGRRAMADRDETFEGARTEARDQVQGARETAAERIGGNGARSYEDRTKDELYQEAADRDIEGRSDMSKEELAAALRRSR